MKLALLALATLATAKRLTSPGFHSLHFNISRGETFQESQKASSVSLLKPRADDGYVLTELTNQDTFYSVELGIGSTNQTIVVLIDTGSSDLWVTGSDNPYCSSSSSSSSSSKFRQLDDSQAAKEILGKNHYRVIDDQDTKQALGLSKFRKLDDESAFDEIINGNQHVTESVAPSASINKRALTSIDSSQATATMDCSEYGTFDSSDSDSFHSNETEFFIVYGDSSFAYGVWGYDTVSIGDMTVENLSFAVANQTNSSVGVLGIGLQGLETTYSGSLATDPYTYANLPVKMVQDGLINKEVYSLYLNDYDADTGSILFGGVDHAKYTGTLTTIPVINTLQSSGYNTAIKLEVTLSSISYNGTTALSSAIPALLDSGTTLTYLPSDAISSIADELGAEYSSRYGYYILDCPSNPDSNITFNFQGIDIDVPLENVILEADSSGSVCVLALIDSGDSSSILGDSFLRAAYIVYDLSDLEVSMAQAYYTDDEDIEVVSSSVPSATTASDYSSTYGASGSGSDSETGTTELVGGIGGEITSGDGDVSTSYSTSTGGNTASTTGSSSSSSSKSSSGAPNASVSPLLWALSLFALLAVPLAL